MLIETDSKLLVLAVALLFDLSCRGERTAATFLMPEGYTGWVQIQFNAPQGQRIDREGGIRRFMIPADGRLMIFGEPEYGLADDKYYYVTKTGPRRLPVTPSGGDGLIWGGQMFSEDEKGGHIMGERFFVGPEEAWKKAAEPHPF